MSTRTTVAVVVVALAAAAAAAVLVLRPNAGASPAAGERVVAAVAEHPTPIPPERRTLLISAAMPTASPAPRLLTGRLERGSMPPAGTIATVVTDTGCTPETFGVSRCPNELRLEVGATIVVRHPHRMAEVPCLAPGEQVVLRRA